MTLDASLVMAIFAWAFLAAGWMVNKRISYSWYTWTTRWAILASVLFSCAILVSLASIYVGWLA